MFTFSHWPKHHLIRQDSGEQSKDLKTCHLSFLVEPVLLAFDNYCHFRIQSLSSLLDPYMPHIRPTSTLESANLEVLMDMDIS